MSAKLVDLRKTVRHLSMHPIFSSRWFQMLGALQRATDAALVEKAEHGTAEESSTLWERKELTVRYLLEEGKLNMCLRLLIQFKTLQREEKFVEVLEAAKLAEPLVDFDDLQAIKLKAALFEQCLGTLLYCALSSVESLQTMDLPALIEHVAETLKFSLRHPEMVKAPDAERRQEVLVIHNLSSLFLNIERLQEDRILELVQEHSVCPLLIAAVSEYHQNYSAETKTCAAQALAGIFSSEAYKTTPTDFVGSVEVKRQVVEFENAFLKELYPDAVSRKKVWALFDCIAKFRYQV